MSRYFSVESDRDGRVTISVRENLDPRPVAVFTLEPEEYLDLLARLTNHVCYALRTVEESIRLGDCPECENIRLVDQERPGGRTAQVHCPRCKKDDESTPWQRPRIGGGVA